MALTREIPIYDPSSHGNIKFFAGRIKTVQPLPLDPKRTEFVRSWSVDFGIEYREHTDNEVGVGIHVLSADTGLEYLRFDCFEERAHYHYIFPKYGFHDRFFVDEAAEGNAHLWALSRIESRLGPMLRRAGAVEEADALDGRALEESMPSITSAVYRALATKGRD